MKLWISVTCLFVFTVSLQSQKPKVWIYTDMSNKQLEGKDLMGAVNDPDDISAMAGYLLMANMFETKGIVVSSTHRKEHQHTPDQGDWANTYFGEAYAKDVVALNQNIGGYPKTINFIQSSIKETAEYFDPERSYASLEDYSSILPLFELAEKATDIINVLIWGSTTEPAIFVKHCLTNNRADVLEKVRFIAHWTNSPWRQGSPEKPEDVANCREDAAACAYMKLMALNGYIQYYECGAIGQHGIVSGGQKGQAFFNQFRTSHLGKIFVEGKYAYDGVDHSDSATYWVLLGNWGVGMNDLNSNGTNPPELEKENEEKFHHWSKRIHNELLRRSNSALD